MDSIELGEELRYILHKYWRDGTVDKPTLHKTNWQVALGGDVWTANGYHGIKYLSSRSISQHYSLTIT